LPLVRKVYLIASDNQRTQAASRPLGVDVLPSDGISAPRTHRANYAACGFCGQHYCRPSPVVVTESSPVPAPIARD